MKNVLSSELRLFEMCTLGTLLKINLTYSFLYIDTRPKPLSSPIKASVNRLISWRRYFYMSSQCDHTVINPFPSHQYLCICLFCWVAKDQTCFEHWTRDIGPSSGNSFGEPGRCTCLMAITSGWASASCWLAPGRGLLRGLLAAAGAILISETPLLCPP